MTHEAGPPRPAEAVVVECELDARPETVWRALTVPEIVAEWLWPNTLVAETGATFTLQRDPCDGGAIVGVVVEAEPPRRLSYAWRSTEPNVPSSPLETLVTFELTGTDAGGTHLRIVHSAPLVAAQATVARMGPTRALCELRPQTRRPAGPRSARVARPALHRRRAPDLLPRRLTGRA